MKSDLLEAVGTELLLEKVRIAARQSIPEYEMVASRGEVSTYINTAMNSLVICLGTYILGLADETIEVHERWPKTWWDHIKSRFFPAWALVRWPVEWERIDISEKRYKAVCPHLESTSDRDKCLSFLWNEFIK